MGHTVLLSLPGPSPGYPSVESNVRDFLLHPLPPNASELVLITAELKRLLLLICSFINLISTHVQYSSGEVAGKIMECHVTMRTLTLSLRLANQG